MGFLRHIRACNRFDPAGFLPFELAGERVGWVRHALADELQRVDPAFVATPERLTLAGELRDFETRSAALQRAAEHLASTGRISRLRGEAYAVLERWGAEPVARIDRAAVPAFGIAAYGLHVNGFVRGADGAIAMWVARRARDREVAPGQYDNMIGGGQPIGLTLAENLVKEAAEEAGIDAALAGRSVAVGAIGYSLETPAGLKRDTLFLYDLELSADVVPRNTDGEVEEFQLWPLDRVAASVRDGDDWKFNVNLVIIDFLVRHGWLTPDHPGYLELLNGLRRYAASVIGR